MYMENYPLQAFNLFPVHGLISISFNWCSYTQISPVNKKFSSSFFLAWNVGVKEKKMNKNINFLETQIPISSYISFVILFLTPLLPPHQFFLSPLNELWMNLLLLFTIKYFSRSVGGIYTSGSSVVAYSSRQALQTHSLQ